MYSCFQVYTPIGSISSKLTADQENRNPRESQVKELQILNVLKFNGIERINKSVTLRYKSEQVPIEKQFSDVDNHLRDNICKASQGGLTIRILEVKSSTRWT